MRHSDSAYTFDAIQAVLAEASGQNCTFSLYQVCLDLGYAYPSLFNESEFVHVGGSHQTGAVGGIAWVFKDKGGLSDEQCVRLLEEHQRPMFAAAGISEEDLVALFSGFPHPPSNRRFGPLNLFAVEGCLCEINKKLNRAHQVNGGRGGKCYRCAPVHFVSLSVTIQYHTVRPILTTQTPPGAVGRVRMRRTVCS